MNLCRFLIPPKLILDNLQGFATTLKRVSNSLRQFLNIKKNRLYYKEALAVN